MTAVWHIFYAIVAGFVSLGATRVIALIEPVGLRRVVVLRPPSGAPAQAQARSQGGASNSQA